MHTNIHTCTPSRLFFAAVGRDYFVPLTYYDPGKSAKEYDVIIIQLRVISLTRGKPILITFGHTNFLSKHIIIVAILCFCQNLRTHLKINRILSTACAVFIKLSYFKVETLRFYEHL